MNKKLVLAVFAAAVLQGTGVGCVRAMAPPIDFPCLDRCDRDHASCQDAADQAKERCLATRTVEAIDCHSKHTDDKFACATNKSNCRADCAK